MFQIHEHMTREEMLSVFYTGHESGNNSKKKKKKQSNSRGERGYLLTFRSFRRRGVIKKKKKMTKTSGHRLMRF